MDLAHFYILIVQLLFILEPILRDAVQITTFTTTIAASLTWLVK